MFQRLESNNHKYVKLKDTLDSDIETYKNPSITVPPSRTDSGLDGCNYVMKYLRSGLNENLSSQNVVQYRFNTCLVLIDNRSGLSIEKWQSKESSFKF